MKEVNAIIERAKDGTFSIYMDADDMDYMVTGTGKSVEEAKEVFEGGYDDIRRYYSKEGKPFTEVAFTYKYDMASFLDDYTKAFTLAGLSRITGINQGQLSHYITGRRIPSARTKQRVQSAIHSFARNLNGVSFV